MAQKRDYYEVLGVAKDADEQQIKKAYWKLAKRYHPDVNPNDKAAEAKFKEANEAYEVLSDKTKRARYDQLGHAGVDASQGFGGGFSGGINLDDLFSSIFGAFGGMGGFGTQRARRGGPVRGASVRYRMTLDFLEAAFGVDRTITIKKNDRCASCQGTGSKDKAAPVSCPTCGGTGQVQTRQQTLFGQMMTTRPCPDCQGRGTRIEHPCPHCHGLGVASTTKRIEVNVPAGINDGEMLSLEGQGEAGPNGGPYGDLFVEVTIRPHPVFERQGTTTFCEVPITFTQAAIGGEILVPTIDGTESFKLKEGAQPGEMFVLRHKGIPVMMHPTQRGDHRFRIVIEVPRHLSSQQKELLKQFEATTSDDNYEKRRHFVDRLKGLFGK